MGFLAAVLRVATGQRISTLPYCQSGIRLLWFMTFMVMTGICVLMHRVSYRDIMGSDTTEHAQWAAWCWSNLKARNVFGKAEQLHWKDWMGCHAAFWGPGTQSQTDWLTQCFTDSLPHSLTHRPIHSLTNWLTHWLNPSLIYSLPTSLTHALTPSLTNSLTHWLTHWLPP